NAAPSIARRKMPWSQCGQSAEKGLDAAAPNGSKWRKLRVRTAKSWDLAIAAMATSAKPGYRPVAIAASPRDPAIRAAVRSSGRTLSVYEPRIWPCQFRRISARRAAPVLSSLAMPVSISITVMVERNRFSEWSSNHCATSGATAGLPGANALKADVSRSQPFIIPQDAEDLRPDPSRWLREWPSEEPQSFAALSGKGARHRGWGREQPRAVRAG